jgi:serine/threonine-protein kinase
MSNADDHSRQGHLDGDPTPPDPLNRPPIGSRPAPSWPAQPAPAAPVPGPAGSPRFVPGGFSPENAIAGQPGAAGVPPPPFVGWGGAPPYWPYPTPPSHHRRRWPWLLITAAVAVIGVVAGLVVWLVHPTPKPPLALTALSDGVLVGYPNVPTTIDIFDEPLCPPCGRFVTSSSADIERAVTGKKIAVRYHLLNFLDGNSPSHDYSTRAIAAAYCVAASKDPYMYMNFYVDMFGDNFQPPEFGTTDRSNTDLADLARSVGTTAAADCVQSGQLVDTAKTKADNAADALKQLDSEVSTPQVYNRTTKVDISVVGWVSRLSNPT